MRTVITVKPDGKTSVTKDDEASEIRRDVQELLERGFDVDALKGHRAGLREGGVTYAYSRSQNNPVGVEVLYFKPLRGAKPRETQYRQKDSPDPESAGKWSVAKNSEGKTVRMWVPSKKTASKEAGEAKDLFIGNRGLSMERSEGYTDHAYDGPVRGQPSPGPTLAVPTKVGEVQIGVKKPGRDSDRRRIVVHNHLPVRRAKDAQKYTDNELRLLGAKLLTRYNKSSEVRDWAQRGKMNRVQEAFIVEGWKQARMDAGVSENV